MMTKAQAELLRFVDSRLRESGVSPTFDEMRDALGLKSKSGIHRLIVALEERGFVRRLPNRARAIEVVKWPDAMSRTPRRADSDLQGPPPVLSQAVRADVPSASVVAIPMMGRIAAGSPIAALQQSRGDFFLAADILPAGSFFGLQVVGDSMIEAGIFDGDTVVLKRQDSAEAGDIVVALIDDEEATLKRLRRRGGSIALEAANAAYETRIFGADRVSVQGKLVALVRRY